MSLATHSKPNVENLAKPPKINSFPNFRIFANKKKGWPGHLGFVRVPRVLVMGPLGFNELLEIRCTRIERERERERLKTKKKKKKNIL
jgi:hypothetical protein